MQLITLEGTDGVGKSSALYGWDAGGGVYEEGAIARLARQGYAPVPTREPGSYGFYPFGLEAPLNKVDFFAWAAQQKLPHEPTDTYELVRHLLYRVRLLTWLDFKEFIFEWKLEAFDNIRTPRTDASRRSDAQWERILKLDPTIRMNIERYTARDCIRHALFHCADSTRLGPVGIGLLFLANHILHQRRLREQPPGTLVISDRYADSQRVYGAVRGTEPIIEDLYDLHSTLVPQKTILITSDPEEIERRLESRNGFERVKQAGKSWDYVNFRLRVQEAYVQRAEADPARWEIVDTSGLSRYEMVEAVQAALAA